MSRRMFTVRWRLQVYVYQEVDALDEIDAELLAWKQMTDEQKDTVEAVRIVCPRGYWPEEPGMTFDTDWQAPSEREWLDAG